MGGTAQSPDGLTAKTGRRWTRRLAYIACAAAMACPGSLSAREVPSVVVSLLPIHSLVAGVMEGVGEPVLLLKGSASPHTFQMRPSDARKLSNANLIVWVGPDQEVGLSRPIANLGAKAEVLELAEVRGIRLLRNRLGGIWARDGDEAPDSQHEDDDHADHDDHDGHDHEMDDEHGDHDARESHADDGHDDHDHGHAHEEHEGDGEHRHGEFDMHIWLDPDNARAIVEAVTHKLEEMDPERASVYHRNEEIMVDRIFEMQASMHQRLAPVRKIRFIVFHDAYQYLERAYGLNAAGTIAVDPAKPPGARRILEIRAALAGGDIRCMFTEPQFAPELAHTVIEGTNIRIGELDPLGFDVEPGPNAWFEVVGGIAASLVDCLSGE